MPDVAVRDRLEEVRAAAGARVRDGPAGRSPHGDDAHAVDRLGRHLHRLGAGADRAGGDVLERRVLAVAVVLAQEDDRQPQHRAEVEALVEVALVDRAVAELADGDAADALEREADARGGGDRPADDPERADEPVLGELMFIEPARPPLMPVARPSISSSSACGSTPSASACPWPR